MRKYFYALGLKLAFSLNQRLRIISAGAPLFLNALCLLPQHDVQTWLNLTAIRPFSSSEPRLKYWMEAQERIGQNNRRLTQFLWRPGLGYAVNDNTSLWFGYAWVYTTKPMVCQSFGENRLWQQILWYKEHPYWNILSRTRLDQRFPHHPAHSNIRLRELVKITLPFTESSPAGLIIYDEVFFHLRAYKASFYDQNRIFIGLGYAFGPHLSAEMGYLNQNIKRRTDHFRGNDFSITVFLT